MSNLDKKYYHNIDLDSNELKAARLYNLTTDERSDLSLSIADKGYIVYDTDDHKSYLWDGYAWTTVSGGGIIHSTATGTDTYTTTIIGVNAYNDGDAYLIRFTNGNTASSPTLQINTFSAKTLYKNNGQVILGGDIPSGSTMLCVYSSSLNGFQCIGTSPNSLFAYVTSAESTVTITKGMPVYAAGAQGERITVLRALNTGDLTSAQTIGIAFESIAPGQKGIIIIQGELDNLSIIPSATWAAGNPVYLGATAGSITKDKPYAPKHLVYLGFVINPGSGNNGNNGRWYVRIQNGYELNEIHDVDLISKVPVTGDSLVREGNLWKAKNLDYLMIAYSIALG